MNYNYLQQGGLTSVPIRPILGGQPHELSYITPEEARMLRQQGGGVTPTGGQYRGPGGLPAFFGHGHGQPNFSPNTHGKSGFSNVHDMNPYSVQTNVDFSVSEGGEDPQSKQFNPLTTRTLKKNRDAEDKLALNQALLKNVIPWNDKRFLKKGKFDIQAYNAHLGKLGVPPGMISQTNKLKKAIDRNKNPGGFFGKYTGEVNTETGETFDLGDIANAPPSAFTGKGSLAGPEMSDIGDMNSPMADVTHGLMSLFSFTPFAPIADALSLASTLGLTGDREFGDMGLLSGLFGLAEEAAPETVDSISEAFSGIVDPVSDIISQGYRSLATPVGEAFGEVGEAFGDAYSGIAGLVDKTYSGSDAEDVVGAVRSIDIGEVLGDAYSGSHAEAVVDAVHNADLGDWGLGDWGLGDPSSVPQGEGGGPGIAMTSKPIEPPPPYVSPTFREDYPDTDDSQDYQRQTSFFDQELTLQDILNRYSDTSNTVTAQEGGGIQGLINNQNKEYSIRNQSNVSSFNKATPHPDLTSGSHGYISNILKGHTVPMGMTNVQQMQKPIEAFPTGGQMNTTNTQYADYSKPQSFYAMPNMNRIT